MRNKAFEKLLKEAVILEAEEQGKSYDVCEAAPIPVELQSRFLLSATNGVNVRTPVQKKLMCRPKFLLSGNRWLFHIICIAVLAAIVAFILLTIGRTESKGAVQPETGPSAEGKAVVWQGSDSEPTPWTGNGHWWTFQPIRLGNGEFGLNVMRHIYYAPLRFPYIVYTENGVAIGRLKGSDETIKLYTSDPEERVIWIPMVKYRYDGVSGKFIRSDVALPEPDPEYNEICITGRNDTHLTLSDTAKAELIDLMQRTESEDVRSSDFGEDQEQLMIMLQFRDFPGLGCELPFWILCEKGRYCLGKLNLEYGEYLDWFVEIDPDSALYREVEQLIAGVDSEQTGDYYFSF